MSYIVRNRSEDERNSFVGPFQNALKSAEGKKPIEEDENRRKLIISKVLADVKGLGEGPDKGNFFHLWHSNRHLTIQQKSKAFSISCSPICSHYTHQIPRNLNNILSLYSKYYPPRLLNDFLSDTECTSLYFHLIKP